ncbi:MAG: NAD(P)-dependent glycerol-3-phosphate dehydrogenase [Oxalobacteraceae bacterium]|nr:NAD(P)-dependent glycerol-3-phosphate dehydrogenase [Oxalobacteraceae bacterium]
MNISVFGAGAWGTALSTALSDRHQVMLFGRDAQAIAEMSIRRENARYLPGLALPSSLKLTSHLPSAISHASDGLMIAATSVAGLRPLLASFLPYALPNLIWLCKGFEEGSALLPHQIVRELMGETLPCGALSGPSFAQEVARGLPCALTIASADPALCQLAVSAIHGHTIRVYSSDDLVGVEVGGAVKNVLAIATGIADGLGLGMNARAALITRGLAEITRLGIALGGRSETRGCALRARCAATRSAASDSYTDCRRSCARFVRIGNSPERFAAVAGSRSAYRKRLSLLPPVARHKNSLLSCPVRALYCFLLVKVGLSTPEPAYATCKQLLPRYQPALRLYAD